MSMKELKILAKKKTKLMKEKITTMVSYKYFQTGFCNVLVVHFSIKIRFDCSIYPTEMSIVTIKTEEPLF